MTPLLRLFAPRPRNVSRLRRREVTMKWPHVGCGLGPGMRVLVGTLALLMFALTGGLMFRLAPLEVVMAEFVAPVRSGEPDIIEPDTCDKCGIALIPGEYDGGCEDCDMLLCGDCATKHGQRPCGGRYHA